MLALVRAAITARREFCVAACVCDWVTVVGCARSTRNRVTHDALVLLVRSLAVLRLRVCSVFLCACVCVFAQRNFLEIDFRQPTHPSTHLTVPSIYRSAIHPSVHIQKPPIHTHTACCRPNAPHANTRAWSTQQLGSVARFTHVASKNALRERAHFVGCIAYAPHSSTIDSKHSSASVALVRSWLCCVVRFSVRPGLSVCVSVCVLCSRTRREINKMCSWLSVATCDAHRAPFCMMMM